MAHGAREMWVEKWALTMINVTYGAGGTGPGRNKYSAGRPGPPAAHPAQKATCDGVQRRPWLGPHRRKLTLWPLGWGGPAGLAGRAETVPGGLPGQAAVTVPGRSQGSGNHIARNHFGIFLEGVGPVVHATLRGNRFYNVVKPVKQVIVH